MNANDILLWMSVRRAGSWASYKNTLEEMATPTDEYDQEPIDTELPFYQRLRLNFERLAHAEFNRQDFQSGWRVVPPTIATISETAIGILCGARTDQLLARIQESCSYVRTTPQKECPDRIEILEDGELIRIASDNGLSIQYDATESLLAALPPIDDRIMRVTSELPFGNDAPVHCFLTSSLEWTSCSPDEARKAPFGLFRWQLPYERHYYLKSRRQAYRVPVQVGKYLALRHDRRGVINFDPSGQVLAVPVTCRPPTLIDRALTLRTGLLPDVEQGKLVYRNISAPIASTTAALLRQ
jgi:hypothetical protein